MLSPLLLSLAPQAAAPELPQHTAPVQSLVRVDVGPLEMTRLPALDLDIAYVDLAQRRVDVIADADDLAALERAGLAHRVVTADLARWYAERSASAPVNFAGGPYGTWLSPSFGQGSMGGYYTYDQLGSVLDQMRAAYPNLISAKTSIGSSLEGDAIWMVRISDNPDVDENEPEARFDSLHHAREPQGLHASLWFMLYLLEEYGNDPLATYLVDERELYFVPVVNPDGYQYNQAIAPGGGGLWRKNRRNNGGGSFGVDLNRNYSYEWGFSSNGSSSDPNSETYRGTSPTSEPEVQAMQAFISAHDFQTALSLHTYSNVWLSPWGYDSVTPPNSAQYAELGALMTEVNGYPYGPASTLLYPANGVTIDYDQGVHDTYSWTPEIGSSSDGFWPTPDRIVPLAEENLLALQRTALAAGAWVRVTSTTLSDAGDGDGAFEPGELVEFGVDLRNSGLASSGAVSLSLSTTSPFASVVSGNTSAGNLGSFTNGQGASPLSLVLAGNVPDETEIDFRITASYGGGSLSVDGSFEAGNRVVLADFDFEGGSAQGWAVGNPNDASTGEWTRVDPLGTAAQPEDDHTQAGTTCWVTGQGSPGGSVGENDVDGGSTTLVSPAFDLSGKDSPRIAYWRWYSNDAGAAPNADVFEVELSNDNGGSWSSVETVGPTGTGTSGGWFEVEVAVASIFATPGSQVRIRFIASDLGSGSIVEAAIDDVLVSYLEPSGGGLGTRYCDPAVANSSGGPASITATGSDVATDNDLVLTASGLPQNQFGYFLGSETQAFNQNPGGSSGNLCVGGNIARFSTQIQNSGAGGTYGIQVDLASVPANPVTAVTAGETWNFTSWYRDVVLGNPTSNFTDALAITFQ